MNYKCHQLVRLCTFPAPEQFGHLLVVGTCRGLVEALDTEIGSTFKHTPLAEHRAQARYPVQRIPGQKKKNVKDTNLT